MKFNTISIAIPLFILISLLFCATTFKNAPLLEAIRPNNIETTTGGNDSIAVTQSITAFLRWYKTNLHQANSFPLLAKDSKGYYMVNKKACINYLNFLKSSHFIAPEYLKSWQTYFDDKAEMLKKDKIESDIPEGFDMDFVLITQEPELILNQIDRLIFNIVSIDKNVALVGLKLPSDTLVQYEFEMRKGKDGWQIGYISTPDFD